MVTSGAGRKALAQREGTKFVAYRDSVGVWTIGTGHTGRMSLPKVYGGMTITAEQADAFLASDLAPTEAAVNSAVKVPVTQNQFDAMVSLAFNIGVNGFRGSSVVRQLNAGNVQAAADDFLMWDIPAELLARRRGERAQFLS